MSDDQKIKERVHAFIRDHYQRSVKDAPRDLSEALLKLEGERGKRPDSENDVGRHFVSKEAFANEANHFSWPPEHLPARERILFIKVSKNKVVVETETASPSNYYNSTSIPPARILSCSRIILFLRFFRNTV